MSAVTAAILAIVDNTWTLFAEAAPWLLFGVLVAGLIKAFVPEQRMAQWLGGRGIWPVSKAALIGAPLPLCSCSVIPVAVGLHRAGASRASTTAFLVSAPETGADSVAASYALLGPFLAVVRPVASIISALITGLLSNLVPVKARAAGDSLEPGQTSCCSTPAATDNCCQPAPSYSAPPVTAAASEGCCGSASSSNAASDDCCGSTTTRDNADDQRPLQRLKTGLHYAITQIFVEFAPWLAIGLLIAGITLTFVPPAALATYGSGLPAILLLLAISVPLYVCATESTPIATALLAAGVSPGAVLVFLMAGPATNVATIGALRKEFGNPFVATYLAGVAGCSIGFGLLTNRVVNWLAIDIVPQFHGASSLLPAWISLPCAAILLLLAVPPLRTPITRRLAA